MANDNVKELELNGRQYNMVDATARQSIDELEISTNNKISSLGVHSAIKMMDNSTPVKIEIDVLNGDYYDKGGTVFITSRFGQTVVVTFGGSSQTVRPDYARAVILNDSYNKLRYPLKLKELNQKTLAIRFTVEGWAETVSVTTLGASIKEVTIKEIQSFDGDEIDLMPINLIDETITG